MPDTTKRHIPKRGIVVAAIAAGVIAVSALAVSLSVGSQQGSAGNPAQEEAPVLFDESPAAEEAVQPQPSEKMLAAESAVKDLVAAYGDRVAVAVQPLDGSAGFSINGDTPFVSASMIKLLVLSEFLDEASTGTISLDSTYVKAPEDQIGGTGSIQGDPIGTSYTYDELAHRMIADSDNIATNVLISRLGMDRINERAKSLDLPQTDLERMMMDLGTGKENHISALDAAKILAGIADHSIAGADLCIKAEGYLLDQHDNEGLAQGLPDGVRFGHKTGSLESVRHDGGIVYGPDPYAIVVLTDIGGGNANPLMAEISRTVYQKLEG